MVLSLTELKTEYDRIIPGCHEASARTRAELEVRLAEAGVQLAVPVTWRVKTWDSIVDKIDRKSKSLSRIEDLSDLVGLRIIVVFERDLVPAAAVVAETVEVFDRDDTRRRLAVDQFGYGSIHLQARPKGENEGLQLEIQVRTAAQHIWAVASHVLQYKQESHVPRPLRRAINRVAALLETADLELERVLADRDRYLEELDESTDGPLDVEVVRHILEREYSTPAKDSDELYADLLEQLHTLGIDDGERFKDILSRQRDRIPEQRAAWTDEIVQKQTLAGFPVGDPTVVLARVLDSRVSFARVALALEFGPEIVLTPLADRFLAPNG